VKQQSRQNVSARLQERRLARFDGSQRARVSIYKIALWLGDNVGVVQKHYAKLQPQDQATFQAGIRVRT